MRGNNTSLPQSLSVFLFLFLSLFLFPTSPHLTSQRYRQSAECQRSWHEDLWGLCKFLGLDPHVRMTVVFWWFSLSFIDYVLLCGQRNFSDPSVKWWKVDMQIPPTLVPAWRPKLVEFTKVGDSNSTRLVVKHICGTHTRIQVWTNYLNCIFICQSLLANGGQFPVCMCLGCCRGLVITMVVSLLFILLLRYTAGVLLWLIVFGVIAVVGYGEYAPLPVATLYVVQCTQVGDAAHIFYIWLFQLSRCEQFCCHGKLHEIYICLTLLHLFIAFNGFSVSLRYLALLLGVQYSEREARH